MIKEKMYKMNDIKLIFGPMRIPFLILAPVCVLLGVSTAVLSGSRINIYHLVLTFIGAVLAHTSVNALNEYSDFKSGLDFNTQPTLFSGGSKTLPNNPEKAYFGLIIGVGALLLTFLIGIYFIYVKGLGLLPIGILGFMVIITYTDFITKSPILCLIAPGIGFGPLMVMGTHYVLAGFYSWASFIASLVPFFLVSDLLLLNQFPDVEADKKAGRKHLLITNGKEASAKVYCLFLICPFVLIIISYFLKVFPLESFLGLIPLLLVIPTIIGVLRYSNDTSHLIPYMGMNVIINILTPLLLAIGLFW